MSLDPTKQFETRNDGVCPIKTATVTLGVGNNQTLISAVTGKRILVLEMQALTSTGTWNIKDGSGGTAKMFGSVAAINNFQLPHCDCGHFESSTATALVADVAVAAVNFFFKYIEYTP